jgi:hypothetical protein
MQPAPRDDDLFDALCVLRGLYSHRGTLDRDAGLSVDAAVIFGEGLMRIARRRDEHASGRRAAPPD